MRSYTAIVSALCKSEGWPAPVAEWEFAPPRKWRFDLAWPGHWLAVEIQGGLFTGGRHVQGAALKAEYEKLNEAALSGWVVVKVLPAQVMDGYLSQLLARHFRTLWPSKFGIQKRKR